MSNGHESWQTLAVLLGLTAVTSCGGSRTPDVPGRAHPLLGQNISFVAPDSRGSLHAVPAAASRATIIDFWATSCAPCQKSVPALAARAAALQADGIAVEFVAVLDRGQSVSDVTETLARWGANTPFVIDREGSLERRLLVESLPATLVVDAGGVAKWYAPEATTTENVVTAARQCAGVE